MAKDAVYFIPGRGEKQEDSLGRNLGDMGFSVQDREVSPDFLRLYFSEQLALIRSDLQSGFWRADAVLIGRSYGGYLLLHTLAEMPPFPGKVLLFSPVLGAGISKDGLFGSIPPRAKRLIKLAESGEFPAPRYLEIHTGAQDNGCDPLLAEKFASLCDNTKIRIVEGAGHRLGEEYVQNALVRFLMLI